METSVLVTEGHTPLGASLVRFLLGRGFRVAAAVDPAAQGADGGWPAEYRAKPFISVSWNRRSPVASHTLLRAVRDAFGSLDEALILEPAAAALELARCASADIERTFDDLKGVAFLVRELLCHFSGPGGVLCLAGFAPRAPDQAGTALEQAVRDGFRGLASALLAGGAPGKLVVNGFQGSAADPEEYAVFIDRTLEEKARKMTGRWFTCPQRAGNLRGRS